MQSGVLLYKRSVYSVLNSGSSKNCNICLCSQNPKENINTTGIDDQQTLTMHSL